MRASDYVGDQMNSVNYYRKRVTEEDERARLTHGTEAELVHRSLAAMYARRALEAMDLHSDNDIGDIDSDLPEVG